MTTRFDIVQLDGLLTTKHYGTQRAEGVNQRKIDKMTASWDAGRVGTISISERKDGARFVIDGAHRVTAARELGINELPAVVHSGLSSADEARLFYGLNDFTVPSAVSRFLARVAAGDDAAVNIVKIAEDHGWKVSHQSDNGNIAAVQALETVYRNAAGTLAEGAHAETLDWVLDVTTAAWGHDRDAAHRTILLGLAQLHGRFGADVDAKKLVSEMAQTRPKTLLGKATGLRDIRGGTTPAHLASILAEMHNKGRRTRVLPDWVWVR